MRIQGRKLALLAVVAAAVVVGLYANRETPVLTDHPGFPTYREYCRRCHGYRGDSKRASRIADRPVSLVAPAFRDTVDVGDVERIVTHGKGKMKGYSGKLTPEEIRAVSRYVLDLPQPSSGEDPR